MGAATVTASMLLLALALTQAPDVGWLSRRTLTLAIATAALMGAFLAHERRSPSPLVRLGILRSPDLVRANLGAMTLLGGWIGFLFITTLYLQQLRNWSAIRTGFAVFPAGLIVAILAPRIAAPLVARHGTTKVIAVGLASHAVAYALFARIGLDSGYVVSMLPTFVLVGVGFALAYGPLNMAATAGVASHEQGLSSGLVSMSLQFGAVLGLAVVTAVNQAAGGDATSPDAVMDGFHAALVAPMLIALSGAAVMATAIRRDVRFGPSAATAVTAGD